MTTFTAAAAFFSLLAGNALASRSSHLRNLQSHDWDEWYVGFVSASATFDGSAEPNVYLTYNGPAPLNTQKYYKISVLDPECEFYPNGDDSVAPTDPDGIITLPSYNADLGTVAASLNIDTATVQSSNVFYTAGSAPEQFTISFCARMELYDSSNRALAVESTIINFNVDTTQWFEIDDLQFEPEAVSNFDENLLVDFPLDIYPCDDSNTALPIANIFPGQEIQVCVTTSADEAKVVNLRSVRLDNSEDEDLQIPLVNANSDVASQQAVLDCGTDGVCNLKTIAYARLFEKPMEDGSIIDISATSKMSGTAILELVSSGRLLQTESSSSGSTGFETDVELATPPRMASGSPVTHSLAMAAVAFAGCFIVTF